MSSEMVLTFALILISFSFVYPKDFCVSFAENHYKISYGFRRIDVKDGTDTGFYLFIDKLFWKLNARNGKLVFGSKDSTKSKWFGKHYSMGFEIGFGFIQTKGKTFHSIGLLNRFMDLIEFRNNKSQELIEFQNLNLKGISFKEFGHPFRPTLVTQTYRWLKNPTGSLAFIEQKNNSIDINFCVVSGPLDVNCSTDPKIIKRDQDHLSVISDFKTSLDIIAIFPVESNHFIFLLQNRSDNRSIRLCSTNYKSNEATCESGNTFLLIDCSDSFFRRYLYYIIGMVGIVVILLIGFILCHVFWKRRDLKIKDNGMSTFSSQATTVDDDSKGDNIPQSPKTPQVSPKPPQLAPKPPKVSPKPLPVLPKPGTPQPKCPKTGSKPLSPAKQSPNSPKPTPSPTKGKTNSNIKSKGK